MSNSVMKDIQGPDWPLGFVKVSANGTPVNIMANVDASNNNAPGTQAGPGPSTSAEYTVRFQQIIFQAYKPGASGGWQNTTGPVYILRAGQGSAPGNRSDTGAIVAVLQPGQTFTLGSAPSVVNVFGPYRYFLDVDSNNDGAIVTGIVQ